eukprot:Colp12_sorted_trinity150504_noHs@15869
MELSLAATGIAHEPLSDESAREQLSASAIHTTASLDITEVCNSEVLQSTMKVEADTVPRVSDTMVETGTEEHTQIEEQKPGRPSVTKDANAGWLSIAQLTHWLPMLDKAIFYKRRGSAAGLARDIKESSQLLNNHSLQETASSLEKAVSIGDWLCAMGYFKKLDKLFLTHSQGSNTVFANIHLHY